MRTNWFSIATLGTLLCSSAALSGDSNCCTAWGGLGCDDLGCQTSVCDVDSYCCNAAWDETCAGEASLYCALLCGGSSSGCVGDFSGDGLVDASDLAVLLGAWGTPGADLDSDGTTNAADLAVLLGAWGDCYGLDACGSGGDCCLGHFTPGCDDATCCEAVCTLDPSCCLSFWDSPCASAALRLCPDLCGGVCGTGGDCCSANGGLGCNNDACCESVCAVDDFCCETEWDSLCAGEAARLCPALCGEVCGQGGDCCTASGGPGCNDTACCEAVCAVDSFCCGSEWDANCATEALSLCGDLCAPQPSNCCEVWGGAGCDDATCQAAVCGVDPFCCNNQWDSFCVNEAVSLCGDLCG
jgi:hypothetical protein